MEVVNGIERISVLRSEWQGTSAGFPERKKHVEAIRAGAEGYGVLCAAKDPHEPVRREIAGFDQDFLLRFGELIDEGSRVYARIDGRVPIEHLARRRTDHSSVVPELKSILAGNTTVRDIMANARVGQGAFRAQVLAMWDSRCCVTGSKTLDAVRASHIKPWSLSTDAERLDPNNGLPLVATLDALFDAGLVTFASDRVLLTSRKLGKAEEVVLGIAGLRLVRVPSEPTAGYLKYHRENRFVE